MVLLGLIFVKYIQNSQKNKETYEKVPGGSELGYNKIALEDLVNKDTDGDGILDWEESLWGTDPTKQETTPGISDVETVNNLKAEQGIVVKTDGKVEDTEKLTQTDKISREIFSTIATLTQNGVVDQNAIEQIGTSLADRIQNSPQRKVYTLADIKVTNDNSVEAIKKYNTAMDDIHKKYPAKGNALTILQKFAADGENVNVKALKDLDNIIKPMQNSIIAIEKINVPESIAPLHLDFLNGLEKLTENLSDIRTFDSDPIVAVGGITQYQTSVTSLEKALVQLSDIIKRRLSS